MAPEKLALLLGLSFFFGLAFEGFYWRAQGSRPGGIRTFPLISLSGAILYALEPHYGIAFCVGLIVLGVWLYPYYQTEVTRRVRAETLADIAATDKIAPEEIVADGIMVPLCNLIAYLLGPVALYSPPWVAFALAVTAVLLLQAKDRLHRLAQTLPGAEVITLGQFLILTGIVLPLLPNTPVTSLTPITPFKLWLAVVVVSSLSYGSYILQKVLPSRRSLFVTSLLGGLYSSTALTVVLARRINENPGNQRSYQSAMILATAVMYLRVEAVVALFNLNIARLLFAPLVLLGGVAVVLAIVCLRFGRRADVDQHLEPPPPANPLEIPTALIFSVLFVASSIASSQVIKAFGSVGIYWLAVFVGVTDIDPFVLSLAQGGVTGMTTTAAAIAILIAASSNNLLKGAYAVAFAGWQRSIGAVAAMLSLSLSGFALALFMMTT